MAGVVYPRLFSNEQIPAWWSIDEDDPLFGNILGPTSFRQPLTVNGSVDNLNYIEGNTQASLQDTVSNCLSLMVGEEDTLRYVTIVRYGLQAAQQMSGGLLSMISQTFSSLAAIPLPMSGTQYHREYILNLKNIDDRLSSWEETIVQIATNRTGSAGDTHSHVSKPRRSKRNTSGVLKEKARTQQRTDHAAKDAQRVQKVQKPNPQMVRRSLRISPSASAASTKIGHGLSSEANKRWVSPSESVNDTLAARRPLPASRRVYTRDLRGSRTMASDTGEGSTSSERASNRQGPSIAGGDGETPATHGEQETREMHVEMRQPEGREDSGGCTPRLRHHEPDGAPAHVGNDSKRSSVISGVIDKATLVSPYQLATSRMRADEHDLAGEGADVGDFTILRAEQVSEPRACEGGLGQGDAQRQGAFGTGLSAMAVPDSASLSSAPITIVDTECSEVDMRDHDSRCQPSADNAKPSLTPPSSISSSAQEQVAEVEEVHGAFRHETSHPRGVTLAVNGNATCRLTGVGFSLSRKFDAKYVNRYGSKILEMVQNTRFSIIRNKKHMETKYSPEKCLEFVEYFLHTCIGGAADCIRLILEQKDSWDHVKLRSLQRTVPGRFKAIVEGLIYLSPEYQRGRKNKTVLASLYSRAVILKMCRGIGEVEQDVACGRESDEATYYYGLLNMAPGSLKRPDGSEEVQPDLKEKLESKSKVVIEKIIRDTCDTYDHWRRLSDVMQAFLDAWGPGAIMFLPAGKQVSKDKLGPMSGLEQMLSIFKEADEEDMLKSLADKFESAIVNKVMKSEELDISESDMSQYVFESLESINLRSIPRVTGNDEK